MVTNQAAGEPGPGPAGLPGAGADTGAVERRRGRASAPGRVVKLTPGQLAGIGQLSDQWSFLWDKRRSLWIAAEDCPDGEQIEEPDLDVLLAAARHPRGAGLAVPP